MEVALDFETKSEVSVKDVGAYVYSRHPSTDVLCFAYNIGLEGVTKLWTPEEPLPEDLYDAIRQGHRLCAVNSEFEYCVWSYVMIPRYGAPVPAWDQWECTATRAAVLALPRGLGNCGNALRLSTVKDPEGRRVMLQLTKPRRPSKSNPDRWFTKEKFPEKYEETYRYCVNDVDAEIAIHRALPPLTPEERRLWLLDCKINRRGVPVDLEAIDQVTDIAAQHSKTLFAECKLITGGEIETTNQVEKLTSYLQDRDVNIPNLRAATVEDALTWPLDPLSRRLLEIRQETSLASIKKANAMKHRANSDGRVRGALLFHGASTGRWAGSGIQLHNPPRGYKDPFDIDLAFQLFRLRNPDALRFVLGSVTEPISKSIRSLVRASPGRRFIVSDFAGIEACVCAWMAGQDDLCRAFVSGEDQYKKIYAKVAKCKPEDVDADGRQLGKVTFLGCQFGMGWSRFQAQAKNAFGLDVDDELADRTVKAFRESYPMICGRKNKRGFYVQDGMWQRLEKAVKHTVETGEVTSAAKCRFYMDGMFLKCILPSSREIAYCEPRVSIEQTPYGLRPQFSFMGVDDRTQWVRKYEWGGYLTENVVQAVARDLLVYCMFLLDSMGYNIIFTVHDEIVCEELYGYGSIEQVTEVMSRKPSWAHGCPVSAEGYESERWRK